ncbi:MAG: hypothetical protein JSS09_08670, partial [Verrucomicrobia bacterium]|nr:hypothetical protein [Verrucomicrobiota bacterium]
ELIKPYELIWFKLCDILLHVAFEKQHVKPPIGFEEGVIMPGPHFAVEIENLSKVRKLLEDHKCTTYDAVIMKDRDRFYGLDPFGNCIEFIEMHKN